MRSLESLWNEVESNPYIKIHKDGEVFFAIYSGCRIQREPSGLITLYNTRTKDEYYDPVGALSLIKFLKNGFCVGAHMLAIDTLKGRVERINKQIQRKNIRGYSLDKKKEKRKELLSNIHEHYTKLELLTTKTTAK